jgi:two-component system, chemotaxis family, chemotaxis protein CheY
MLPEAIDRRQPPPCVLIVDDQPDARDTLGELLELEGCDVEHAADGSEAWEYLERKRGEDRVGEGGLPDVILLDLMMPRMNGWEFRERQLADARFRHIPVVVVSGADHTEQSLSRLGAVEYFVKPLDIEKLIATVERLCQPVTGR